MKALIREAGALAKEWTGMLPVDKLAVLKKSVHRVTLDEKDLSIEITGPGLAALLISRDKDTDPLTPSAVKRLQEHSIVLTAPARLKRCGSELRLVIPNEKPGDRPASPNAALIKGVARAHLWREQLLAGKVRNPDDIAQRARVTPRYVRDILKLVHLSPRVVEMILDGKQPLDLTVDGLIAGLPLDWKKQEQMFGMA